MTATWDVRQSGDDVWVSGPAGRRDEATAYFRVRAVDGAASIVELRVTMTPDTERDGMDALFLRAIPIRGVREAAEPYLAVKGGSSWQSRLRAIAGTAPGSRDREILLTAIGYIAAVDGGSQRPLVEIADALALPLRRVRANVQRARDRAMLGRADAPVPRVGHWRGRTGGVLTPYGDQEFARILGARLNVHPEGVIHSHVSAEPGTAAMLLTFLTEPPIAGPTSDFCTVSVDPGGAHIGSLDHKWGPERTTEAGVRYRLLTW